MAPPAVYYLDTSALVKRYLSESGSAFVSQLFGSQRKPGTFFASALTYVEMVAAFTRRVPQAPESALQQFVLDWRGFRKVPVDADIISRGAALAQLHRLRAADAIQLASALRLAASLPGISLLTSDAEMLLAAKAEGLQVDNPNLYR